MTEFLLIAVPLTVAAVALAVGVAGLRFLAAELSPRLRPRPPDPPPPEGREA